MAERGFQTELWTDPFIQGLPPEAKLLFIYLWTNKHCNQAGLYEITMKTIAFDTGIPQESLPSLLAQLEPKVAWYAEQNLVWVKNFLKRQCKSQSLLVAAAKCLKTIRAHNLVKEFINYNHSFNLAPLCEHEGGIVVPPWQDGGTTIINPVPVPDTFLGSIPDDGAGKGKIVRKGVVKGEGAKKQSNPVIAEILAEMKSYLGYPEKIDKDPIPNYAKEGQFLKKILRRHFTREEILSCWKVKVQQRRGEFVSMTWVNEDIAAFVHRQVKGGTIEPRELRNTERKPAQPGTKPHDWTETPENANFSR